MGSQVILATAGYDHTIKLWEATSGICYRTLQYADSQASLLLRIPTQITPELPIEIHEST